MVFKIFRCRNTSGIDSNFALTSYIEARMFVAKKLLQCKIKKKKRERGSAYHGSLESSRMETYFRHYKNGRKQIRVPMTYYEKP